MTREKTDTEKVVQPVEDYVKDAAQKQENFNKTEQYKRKLQEFQEGQAQEQRLFQQRLSEFVNKYARRNDKGEVVGGPWETSDEHAKKGLDSETTAFNSEWKNAMLSLLGSFGKMCEAMNYSLETNETIGKMAIKHAIKTAVSGYFNKPSEPDLTKTGKAQLPVLMHHVTLDADNKLQVRIAKDNMPMKDDFNKLFKSLVTHWLEKNGYKPGQTPETQDQYFAQDGTKLTQAKMKDLQEGEHSLQNFLEENSSLTYQSTPTLS
ncbi:hypothetical protein [Legionella sp. km772]|uniref:hypothetical protein n=1 Tax=Legionella sp. km772 TaxID=2498111 RepID=UPI000F8F7225|nr:hypothetical protein [Legionella sp. km772]RUR12812.1 hypothetical protein ELY15_04030 [Legionella sp. km772]